MSQNRDSVADIVSHGFFPRPQPQNYRPKRLSGYCDRWDLEPEQFANAALLCGIASTCYGTEGGGSPGNGGRCGGQGVQPLEPEGDRRQRPEKKRPLNFRPVDGIWFDTGVARSKAILAAG